MSTEPPDTPFAVVVTLPDAEAHVGEQVIAHTNGLLSLLGLWVAGPRPLPKPLPDRPDDRGITLLRALAALRPRERVVAITGRVLYGARGREIEGEAAVGGRVGVVSARDGLDAAVGCRIAHEVGHMRGLRHCGALACVMNPKGAAARAADGRVAFCDVCRGRVSAG